MKIRPMGAALVLALIAAVGIVATRPVKGDQQDTPFALANPAANVTDTYLFPSPSNPNNVVAVMNLYPYAAAGQGNNTFFLPNVLYQMKFDSKVSGEPVGSSPSENLVIQFLMTLPSAGTQQVLVYGPQAPVSVGTNNALGTQSGTGLINTSFNVGSMTVFAGVRENPLFFDMKQWYNIVPNRNGGSAAASCLPNIGTGTCPQGFNTPGNDSLAGSNVLSIVVEMPTSVLEPGGTGPKVAYWATTGTPSGS